VNDTPTDVDKAFTALLMQRSPSDRAMMAFEMFDMARALMTADIRAHHPGISDVELRVKIFERTYRSDFSDIERARIVAHIRRSDSASPPA
jgi:hypothetical protein